MTAVREREQERGQGPSCQCYSFLQHKPQHMGLSAEECEADSVLWGGLRSTPSFQAHTDMQMLSRSHLATLRAESHVYKGHARLGF